MSPCCMTLKLRNVHDRAVRQWRSFPLKEEGIVLLTGAYLVALHGLHVHSGEEVLCRKKGEVSLTIKIFLIWSMDHT